MKAVKNSRSHLGQHREEELKLLAKLLAEAKMPSVLG